MSSEEVTPRPGGLATVSQSTSSPGLSQDSLSSQSYQPSRVATLSASAVSLTVIAIITHAWWTGRLASAPWWAPLAGIVIAAVPGGVLGAQIGTVGRAAVGGVLDRFPRRDK